MNAIKRNGLCIALLAILAGSVSADDHVPFGDQIEARQAVMLLYGYSLGQLGAMARGKVPYDADLAQAAADNLAALATMDNRTLWPPGSDASAEGLAGVTRAKAEAWAEDSDVIEYHNQMVLAAEAMAAQASDGLDAVRGNIGAIGKSCKGCHDKYRTPDR